jgi:hypothetical protein
MNRPRIIGQVAHEGTIVQWLMTISSSESIVSLSVENGKTVGSKPGTTDLWPHSRCDFAATADYSTATR